jgi:excisionase family DNA binding protein
VSMLAQALLDELDDEVLDRLAELLAPRLVDWLVRQDGPVWVDAAGAAEHLSTSRGRVYDLVQLGKLEPRRDGRRLLFRRADLDAYLEAAA